MIGVILSDSNAWVSRAMHEVVGTCMCFHYVCVALRNLMHRRVTRFRRSDRLEVMWLALILGKCCWCISCPFSPSRILFTCHGVFYKQLSAWLLHGLLRDNHKEFFIEPTTARLEALKATREDREEENRGETSDSGRAQFIINPVLAPSYIPVGVMEKVM